MSVLFRHFVVLLLCVSFFFNLEASTFQINPTRITLSRLHSVAVLKIGNESDAARVMQLKAMSWTQHAGEDRYAATSDLLATPPIFTLPPGGTQIVRVGLRRQPDKLHERAYRLFLQEVPVEGESSAEVKVTLRFGIPVFVAPLEKTAHPLLEWRVGITPDKALRVEATNHGEAHVQITGFSLQDVTNHSVLAEHRGMDYLLPGQSRSWSINASHILLPGTRLKISGQTDAGEVDAEAVLGD
ncbi:fimbrial biogenesis chaperone [Nitrosomonas sp. ANs5]|uniref:fimbrial biogenesis chaperone n=1 Tax=Nitrosomonas sp. ANs5 TaxID=3423941 RepID=UPI003D33E836